MDPDPVPPGFPIDPAQPASCAVRPPNYRRIHPLPPLRRSSPFSKHPTRNPLADCNVLDGLAPLTSSSLAVDEVQPPLIAPAPVTSSSSAVDEIQPSLTAPSAAVGCRQTRPLTADELWMANFALWYKSIVLFVFAVIMIRITHHHPTVMIADTVGILCIYMSFWCKHITQFWMNRPYYEDHSPFVLVYCLSIFMLAAIVGIGYSSLAALFITCLGTSIMAGCLIGCIREYNSTKVPSPLNEEARQECVPSSVVES